jgi:peptidoglycan/LPS O-acetylase OafA/YrhL
MLGIYLAVMVVWTLVGAETDLARSVAGSLYGFVYVVNLVVAVNAQAVPWELRHLWSLGQEEQFYILWPAILFGLLRARLGGWTIALFLVGLVALTGGEYRMTSIVLGCIAGIVFTYRLMDMPAWLGTLALPFAVALAVEYDHAGHGVVPIMLFTIPASVIVVAGAAHKAWWFARVLSCRPLRWFGKISYGLYVWHWPLFAAAGWRLGLPLSIAAAVLSYRYVEEPLLRHRHRPRAHAATREHSPAQESALWQPHRIARPSLDDAST